MADRVSPDQLSALLHERLEVGLGPRSGVPTPAVGVSSPSPHGGGTEQGTFLGTSGGLVELVGLSVICRLFLCLQCLPRMKSPVRPSTSKIRQSI